jgi:multidrug efflux pump subunit AcrA (membrane-fusion protein)
MHAKAFFEFSNNRRGLVLPRKAITGSLQDAKVYVVENDSIAIERPVKLGVSAGEKVEVTAGLSEGERVVVSGQMNLHQGARVQIVKEQ